MANQTYRYTFCAAKQLPHGNQTKFDRCGVLRDRAFAKNIWRHDSSTKRSHTHVCPLFLKRLIAAANLKPTSVDYSVIIWYGSFLSAAMVLVTLSALGVIVNGAHTQNENKPQCRRRTSCSMPGWTPGHHTQLQWGVTHRCRSQHLKMTRSSAFVATATGGESDGEAPSVVWHATSCRCLRMSD